MKIIDGKLVDYNIEDIAYIDKKSKKIIAKIPDGVTQITNGILGNEPVEIVHIPDSVKILGYMAFANAKYLENLKGMHGVTKIGKKAFLNTELKSFDCPPQLKEIGASAFEDSNLRNISFNDELTSIGEIAFRNTGLRDVILPESVISLGEGAFQDCLKLETIELPSKLSFLPSALCYDSGIRYIKIPKNVRVIGEGCFDSCQKLEDVRFEEGLTTIANEAFENCSSLYKIYLPSSVESIGNGAFARTSILNMDLPENLVYLGENVFYDCENLKSVSIGDKLVGIGQDAFYCCSNLRTVKLGKNIKSIGAGAFAQCKQLKSISLPDGLESVGESAFVNCLALKSVEIPSSVKNIEESAFAGCNSLEEVYIPSKDVELEDGAFASCSALKSIVIEEGYIGTIVTKVYDNKNLQTLKFGKESDVVMALEDLPTNLKYLCKDGDYFVVSSKPVGTEIVKLADFDQSLYLGVITSLWDNKERLKNICDRRGELTQLINDIYENLDNDQLEDFVNNAKFKFYDQWRKQNGDDEYINYFYSLGGFKPPVKEERISKKGNKVEVVVDYGQKVCEFFKSLSQLTPMENYYLEKSMKKVVPTEFNSEATNFLLNIDNTKEIITSSSDLLSLILSNFKEVQATNKSRKGSQRQLAPTVTRFKEYFNNNQFSGVEEEDRDIAEFLSKYYTDQSTYDTAIDIKHEKESNGVGDSILGEHLQEDDAFKQIDAMSLKIKQVAGETVDSILSSTTDYTFDWLEKSDPNNYVLGRLCNCCAELESAGFGIMHASIVHPDVQNLVIRNNEGKIVAKSTLYLNREKGYGVFNNIQVSHDIPVQDEIKVYKKYKIAVAAFVKAYNEKHPEKPIKQINIGMRINSLSKYLEEYDKESTEILEAIDYGRYGLKDGGTYNGDSKSRQMVVWEDEKQ